MLTKRAAVSLKVHEEETQNEARGDSLLDYLEPSLQEHKTFHSTPELVLDDQTVLSEPPKPTTAVPVPSSHTVVFSKC